MDINNQQIQDPSTQGTGGLRGLNGINRLKERGINIDTSILNLSKDYRGEMAEINQSATPTQNIGFVGVGESMYDKDITSASQLDNLANTRGELQPWYSQIGAGLAKGAILAGTTFLDGTVGLVLGGGQAIKEGRASALWDNPFSKAMQSVNEWSEEVLPNYYTDAEKNEPWYNNIFTANFLGDKFIKNLGFTVGAFYSGNVAAKGLKVSRLPELIGAITKSSQAPAIVTTGVGATISAVNEGRIEALNNSKDWFELHKAQLDDQHQSRLKSIESYIGTDLYPQLVAKENSNYEAAIGKLTEDRLKMGNADLLMNIPILTASNIIQFGRMYANGFKTARKATNIVGSTGEYAAKGSTTKGMLRAGLNPLSEGMEEISQGAASRVSGAYYSDDVNNFYKSKIDPEAEQQTLSWMKSFAQGINETVNEGSSWEEFFIGTLTGALGMPRFRGIKNNEGKYQSPITIEGGTLGEYREYKENLERDNTIANYMNNRVNSPEFINYYQGLIRHNKYQNDMNNAVIDNNEFEFKNAEHAQLISDIAMFDNAGKLDDLNTLINSAYDTSDANLQSIVENTTSTTTDTYGKEVMVGPFIDKNGNPMYSTEEGKKEMIEKLTKTKEEMLSTITNYSKIKDDIDVRTGQQFSDDQLEELTWLKSQIGNWQDRAAALAGEIKPSIGTIIGTMSRVAEIFNSIKTAEGTRNTGLSDTYLKSDSNENTLRKNMELLGLIQGLNAKELSYLLAQNPDMVKGLKSIIEDETFGLDADEASMFVSKIDDIVKLVNATGNFKSKLKEYLETPNKLQESLDKTVSSVAKSEYGKKKNSLKESLLGASNLDEFRKALESSDDVVTQQEILKELENEGNQLAKDFKEVNAYRTDVERAINNSTETAEVKANALKLLQDQFSHSNNLQEIANPNSIFIDNDTALYDDTLTEDQNTKIFQEAQYALLTAMNQINNENTFKDRFSTEYKTLKQKGVPNKSNPTKDTTGDSGTSTVPVVNNTASVEVYTPPVGNVTSTQVEEENRKMNDRVETPNTLDDKQKGKRPYYRPSIPELHIQGSKEGDFRPFNVVVSEREKGVNFDDLYNYLKDNGAFSYVNEGNLKAGDVLGFMIDPAFNDHTIFIIDKRNNQIVGSLDESQYSVNRYEGLHGLEEKIKAEYKNTNKIQKPSYFSSMATQLKDKKSSWEYYRDDINRVYSGIEYVTGPAYQATLEPAIRFAIDSGVLPKKYNKYLGKTKENAIEKEDLQEIIDELKKIGINNPSELLSYVDLNSSISHTKASSSKNGSESTVGAEIAGDYLLTGGIGVLSSSYYLLRAIGDVFSNASTQINSIRIKYVNQIIDDNLGYIKDFVKSDLYTQIISEIRSAINKSYNNNSEVESFFDEILKYPTGVPVKVGNMIDARMNELNSPISHTNKFIATPTTKVAQIMVGKVAYGNEERSLSVIPNVKSEGRNAVFGIVKNGTLSTNSQVSDSLITKPVDMSQKEGRMYLLIPNAAGKYTPVAVRVKHFNREEYNPENVEVQNTTMFKNIQESVDLLSNAQSEEDLNGAVKSLKGNLYSGDLHIDWFTSDAGNGIRFTKVQRDALGNEIYEEKDGKRLRKETTKTVFLTEQWDSNTLFTITGNNEVSTSPDNKSIEDIKNEITNILLDFNLPIQVNLGMLNKGGYNNMLINSNILTSNITDARVIGNWFTTDYFDSNGNIQKAVSPISVMPDNTKKVETPVGGKEGIIPGIEISMTHHNRDITVNVDITSNKLYRQDGKDITSYFSDDVKEKLFDLAWAESNFGNNTESSVMTDNKVITPNGKVLDRSKSEYLEDSEAQKIKDKIKGKNTATVDSNITISKIAENQKKVNKEMTDGNYYYILEEDGQYHQYERVHTRLGSNWVESKKQSDALKQVKVKLSQLSDNTSQYNNYLKYLSNHYKVDLTAFEGKIDIASRDTVVLIIKDKMSGTNSQRALNAGSAVDTVIRNFFTSNDAPVKPDNMSDQAFIDLISSLTEIRSNIEARGERFLTNNIVLFNKYPDGTRIAGEVDILSVDADGNFRIYDVKTSRYSFYDFVDRHGNKVNYFQNKSATQNMSTKDYYTLQLSAYKNLFESQYGVPVKTLAVLPFVLNYDKDTVSSVTKEKGIMITYNPSVNVPSKGSSTNTSNKKVEVSKNNKGGKYLFNTENTIPVVYVRTNKNNEAQIEWDSTKKSWKFKVIEENGNVKDPIMDYKLSNEEVQKFVHDHLDSKYVEFFESGEAEKLNNKDAREGTNSFNKYLSDNFGIEFTELKGSDYTQVGSDSTYPINNSALEIMDPINDVLPEFKLDNSKVGYYVIDGKLHKGYLSPIGTINGIDVYMTKVPNITKGFGRPGEVAHVASNSYMAVFPNGNTITLIKNDPKTMSEQQAKDTISKMLNGNPTRVVDMANEKTLISETTTSSKVEEKPITTSTVIESSNISGASKTLQAEQSISESDEEFEDELDLGSLRKVDSDREIWNQEKELDWLSKVLPQLSQQDRIKVVKGLIKVGNSGATAWGQFNNGIITLSDIAAEGTTYHEAFHVVFQLLLDNNEKQSLLDEAKEIYGNKSDIQLEEDMAEGFREYVMSQDNKGLGSKVLNFFKELFAKVTNWKYMKPSLISYYQAINQGKYNNSNIKMDTIVNTTKQPNTLLFENLDSQLKELLLNKGWTQEQFDSISQEERDQAVKCISL